MAYSVGAHLLRGAHDAPKARQLAVAVLAHAGGCGRSAAMMTLVEGVRNPQVYTPVVKCPVS
jgi:hypothetical protein